MNVFLFQPRFEQPILSGHKNATIRKARKDGRPRAHDGQAISLRVWTGPPYRSRQREFAQRTIKFHFPVRVHKRGIQRIDTGAELKPNYMAKALGFATWPEARDWYQRAHGLPFTGELFHFPASAPSAPSRLCVSALNPGPAPT
jgi:hypothetical protein